MTVNKVILIGNLGADPEMRTAQSGTTITKLRLATSESMKGKDGNWTDHTEWHRVTCFGRTAETAAQYLSKGRQVYIEGRLRTSKYNDKDGVEKYSTEVICDRLRFLGRKSDNEGSSGGYSGGGGSGGGYSGGSSGDGGGSGGGYSGGGSGSGGSGGGSGSGGSSGGGYGGDSGGSDADEDIPF